MKPNFTPLGGLLSGIVMALLALMSYSAQAQGNPPEIVLTPLGGTVVNGTLRARVQITVSGGDGPSNLIVIRETNTTSRQGPQNGVGYNPNPNAGVVALGSAPQTVVNSNNFVVLAEQRASSTSVSSVIVTGLTLSTRTNYTVEAYFYSGDGTSSVYSTVFDQENFTTRPTYEWIGSSTNEWTNAASWRPTRDNPSSEDVIVFNGLNGTSATVNFNLPNNPGFEAINQFVVTNIVNLTFNGANAGTLRFTELASEANAGDDFRVDASSVMDIITLNRQNSVRFELPAGETATIAGNLSIGQGKNGTGIGGGVTSTHRIVKTGDGTIRIRGLFQLTQQNEDNVFEGSKPSAVVVEDFGVFEQNGGLTQSPFGSTTSPIATFEPESIYRLRLISTFTNQGTNNGFFNPSGQTLGTLEFLNEISASLTVPLSAPLIIRGNLNVLSGGSLLSPTTTNISFTSATATSTSDISVARNITVTGTATSAVLSFNQSSANALVTLNGGIAQTISGAGTINFADNVRLVINNTSIPGVTLLKSLIVPRLTLARGIVTTLSVLGSSNLLTVAREGNTTDDTRLLVTAGNGTDGGNTNFSFINGPLARSLTSTPAGARDLFYPIGVNSGGVLIYRPLTLTANSLVASTATVQVPYIAQQIEGMQTTRPFGQNIARVSRVRYYQLSTTATTAPTNVFVRLSFGNDDEVNDLATLIVVRDNGSVFENLGGAGTATGTADSQGFFPGSVRSTLAGVTNLGNFSLGSTVVATNPLPVELSAFTAQRQSNGVLLRWRTASELNNERFEVQRSVDGERFATVATVRGNGTTTTATTYSATDLQAPSGLLYYRLRQVDADGTSKNSQVVTVNGNELTQVFPNPVVNELNIQSASVQSYRVLNATGKAVLSGQMMGATTLNMTNLKPGMYLLELNDGSRRVMHRFVKQ